MSNRRELILIAAQRVLGLREDLRKAEAQLDALIVAETAERVRELPLVTPTTGALDALVATARAFIDAPTRSMAKRIVTLTSSEPTRAWTASEIAAGIGNMNEDSVRASIARLVADGLIVRVERGRYRYLVQTANPDAETVDDDDEPDDEPDDDEPDDEPDDAFEEDDYGG
jgi:hypothetical protein